MSDQKRNNQGDVGKSHVSFPKAQGSYQTDGSLRPKPTSTYGFDSKSSLTAKKQQNLAGNSQNLPPEKSRLNLFVNLAETLIKKITRR
jgi:hypothetical protein